MPELPEVETVARQLAVALRHERLKEALILDSKLEALPNLCGSKVAAVKRVGKQVGIFLLTREGEAVHLLVHLRMTGRLIWKAKGFEPLPGKLKYVRALFRFSSGVLLFEDVRRFGTIRCFVELPPCGLDPCSADFTVERLESLLSGARQNIKQWLLRQDRLVGIGNIYASEILFQARIRPARRCSRLKKEEIKALFRATRSVIMRAVKNGGTTFSDYQDSRGELGSHQRFLKVYAREGLPCRICRTPIRRVIQGGRSTFYCRTCQR